MKNAFKGLFLTLALGVVVLCFLIAYGANLVHEINKQEQQLEQLTLRNDSLRYQIELRKDLTRALDVKIKAKQKIRREK
jgi:cell division protein FtsB